MSEPDLMMLLFVWPMFWELLGDWRDVVAI